MQKIHDVNIAWIGSGESLWLNPVCSNHPFLMLKFYAALVLGRGYVKPLSGKNIKMNKILDSQNFNMSSSLKINKIPNFLSCICFSKNYKTPKVIDEKKHKVGSPQHVDSSLNSIMNYNSGIEKYKEKDRFFQNYNNGDVQFTFADYDLQNRNGGIQSNNEFSFCDKDNRDKSSEEIISNKAFLLSGNQLLINEIESIGDKKMNLLSVNNRTANDSSENLNASTKDSINGAFQKSNIQVSSNFTDNPENKIKEIEKIINKFVGMANKREKNNNYNCGLSQSQIIDIIDKYQNIILKLFNKIREINPEYKVSILDKYGYIKMDDKYKSKNISERNEKSLSRTANICCERTKILNLIMVSISSIKSKFYNFYSQSIDMFKRIPCFNRQS